MILYNPVPIYIYILYYYIYIHILYIWIHMDTYPDTYGYIWIHMDTYGYIWIHMVKSMCIYMIYILFASIYYKMVKPGMHHCKMDTNHHQSGYRRGMSRIPQTPDMTQG